MSEAALIKKWFKEGALLHPMEGENIVDVTRSLVDSASDDRRLVFVLLDGFGMNLYDKLMEEYHGVEGACDGSCNSFFCRFFNRKVRSVFPATTAAALAAYGTGKFPSQHGLLGWTLRYPLNENQDELDSRGIFFNPLPWKNERSQDPLSIPDHEIFWFESIWKEIKQTRYSVSVYADSRLRKAQTGTIPKIGEESAQALGYGEALKCDGLKDDLQDGLEIVEAIWREKSGSFTYVYCHCPDRLEHEHGVYSPIVIQKLKQLDSQLMDFWNRTKSVGNRRILVCADHGQVNGEKIEIPRTIELEDDLGCAGELRLDFTLEHRCPMFWLTHLDCTRKCSKDELIRLAIAKLKSVIVSERLKNEKKAEEDLGWVFLLPEEFRSLNIFGPSDFAPAATNQVGHFLALTRTFEYLTFADEDFKIVGLHGSMVKDEMLLPLFVADDEHNIM